MAWDRRGYYYQSRKVAGRVQREYFGRGPLADLTAEMDYVQRLRRKAEREAREAERARADCLDDLMQEVNEVTDLVAEAVLVASGYHQHKRGEWRRRRAQRSEPG